MFENSKQRVQRREIIFVTFTLQAQRLAGKPIASRTSHDCFNTKPRHAKQHVVTTYQWGTATSSAFPAFCHAQRWEHGCAAPFVHQPTTTNIQLSILGPPMSKRPCHVVRMKTGKCSRSAAMRFALTLFMPIHFFATCRRGLGPV